MGFDDETMRLSVLNPDPVAEKIPVPVAIPQVEGVSEQSGKQMSVAQAVVKMLKKLKVTHAFGILGGAIAPLVAELENSVEVHHCRHESGAAFAACEAYFASETYKGKKKAPPVEVFATTGPGITNALTGLLAARGEGAKIIFLSGATYGTHRGRLAAQETSTYAMSADLFVSGKLFDYAKTIESVEELPEVFRQLAKGMQQPGGFIAHLNIPTRIQSSSTEKIGSSVLSVKVALSIAHDKAVKDCAKRLSKEQRLVIWVGFEARHATKQIRKLAKATGAWVMCSPRAKGVFPENHPQFLGVTGFGGHPEVLDYLRELSPERILVLGTNLGEFTSFWNPGLAPKKEFICVSPDQKSTGFAYPEIKTRCIQSEIGSFVKKLRKQLQKRTHKPETEKMLLPRQSETILPRPDALVHPAFLMDRIQEVVVENSKAVVMAEPGNSFAWAMNCLKFTKPGRFRTSTCFASMGHMTAGVVGAAEARNGKAVAIVGDGSMLMNGSEVSTAVKYNIPAVWVVLNDGCYNMCEQGMARLGFHDVDLRISEVDFAAIARAMGAESVRVERDVDVEVALEQALASTQPFVVDVAIDPSVQAPIGTRIQSLVSQGSAHQ